jgi:hypothetical protein
LRPWIRALLASVLVCGAGLAQPLERGSYRMVWKAPPECPADVQVLGRIEALLGVRVSELELVPLAARGRITRTVPSTYELVLETFQGEQRFLRTMKATSCQELTDAGALVIALAIDPTLSERRANAGVDASEPSGAETPSSASAAAPVPSAAPARISNPSAPALDSDAKPRPQREHGVRFLLGARGVVDFGSVADVAVGPGLGVAVQWRALEASLDGVWLPARRTFAAPGKGGDITLAAASLRGCYRPVTGTLQALGCAWFELGSLDGNGVGTVVRAHRSGLWAAPGGSLTGRARLGSRVLVSVGAGALLPIQPIDFTLDNIGLVRSVPPLVGRLEAGLQAHFD